ncbi:ImmA/IrrE family metallo-endopeptidase [Hyphomonas oceanitis]|nr:ImmA/IrrE family metallo-endopeptidase [Hyphomonas oceanitis]
MIDVFGAIEQLEIPLVFKPLKTALGLCLPKPLSGIMVTTERGLYIQRFTAAHELGHAVLGHSGSVDREFNYRAMLEPASGQDFQELAADAFAAEFMLPRWLYKHHVQQQGWTVQRHLQNPDIVYQLSLRMGASYEATCWGLLSHDILNRTDVELLLKTKVAQIKQSTGETFRPANSWANTWRISAKDHGATLTVDPDDLIKIDLEEAAGSGYQWNLDKLRGAGFEVISDRNQIARDPVLYGGGVRRTLITRPPEAPMVNIDLSESQPWQAAPDNDRQLRVSLIMSGKESGGLSRIARINRGAVEK